MSPAELVTAHREAVLGPLRRDVREARTLPGRIVAARALTAAERALPRRGRHAR